MKYFVAVLVVVVVIFVGVGVAFAVSDKSCGFGSVAQDEIRGKKNWNDLWSLFGLCIVNEGQPRN